MSETAECWAVIPATGIGQRMQADRPKQYLHLADKTILQHTLDNLLSHPSINGVVLVLHAQDAFWQQLSYRHEKPVLTCLGGEQRHHSVLNGLIHLQKQLKNDAFVLIHDAVRPFVQHADLDRLIETIQTCKDGAILAVPVADTLKFSFDQQNIANTHSRSGLWRAFTPQAFKLSIITEALSQVVGKGLDVTDDASAMELAGYHPKLLDSDHRNIKITHPQDLVLANLILNSLSNA